MKPFKTTNLFVAAGVIILIKKNPEIRLIEQNKKPAVEFYFKSVKDGIPEKVKSHKIKFGVMRLQSVTSQLWKQTKELLSDERQTVDSGKNR